MDYNFILSKLEEYVESEEYKGYDPYDGLNSPVSKVIKGKYFRILLTQMMKITPINLRPMLGIKKECNPKGIGLFVIYYLLKYKYEKSTSFLKKILPLLHWLVVHKSKGYSGYSWGYNFDWQSRVFFIPKGTPTIVNSCFIGKAFLNAFLLTREEFYLKVAKGVGEFIVEELNRYEENNSLCFSYTPLDKIRVHNANMLGGEFLLKLYTAGVKKKEYVELAERCVKYSVEKQNKDGSWYYGEEECERWVDNFHTGFVLNSLYDYIKMSKKKEYWENLVKGYKFYLHNFVTKEGKVKYYSNKLYPIDIHAVAQTIITLVKLNQLDKNSLPLAHKVAKWGIENMRSKEGYFYYRIGRVVKNKIPYIRWGQAWMLVALGVLHYEEKDLV
jgi:rhamnogalacturonyl hydrolase YesR